MAKEKTTAQKQLEKAKADYVQSFSSSFDWIKNQQSILKGNGPIVKEPAKGPAPITTLPAVKTKDGDVKITATDEQIANYYENYHLTQVAEAKKEKEKTTTQTTKEKTTTPTTTATTTPETSDTKKDTEKIGSIVTIIADGSAEFAEKLEAQKNDEKKKLPFRQIQ